MLRTLISIFCLCTTLAAQATINVPADHTTIQAGIAAAANGDTVLVAPGTYLESDISFLGKDITVRSSGGADVTVVDAQNMGRGFYIDGGVSSAPVLEGFHVMNGRASTSQPYGGGILLIGSTPVVRHCIIENCSITSDDYDGFEAEGSGGGLCVSNGSALIESCRFFDNRAAEGFDGNSFAERGGDGGHGGGLCARSFSSVTVVNCIFDGNEAGRGGDGGVSGDGGDGGEGGAIAILGGGSATILNCTVRDCAAGTRGFGGSGFPSDGDDGDDGEVGGIWIESSGGNDLRSLIVRGCQPTSQQVDAGFAQVSYSNVEGGVLGGAGNIDADPLFEDALNRDFRLQLGSPCINAGSPDETGLPPFDIDLMDRVLGNRVDMGAHETATLYGGSGEDFRMDARINGTLIYEGFSEVTAGDTVNLYLYSPSNGFGGSVPLLVAQFFTTGFHPGSPVNFPEVHVVPTVNPGVLVVYDGNSSVLGPLGLTSTGLGFLWTVPSIGSLSGESVMLQAFALSNIAANNIFASSDGFELRFL